MVRYIDFLSDTICSPITAPGYSGVSLIRISGDKAVEVSKKIIKPFPEKPQSHTHFLSSVRNLENKKIDQVLVSYFEKGQSFTGDETVEISCHGNPLIINEVINILLELGCRSAERGEFSFRSFYNGKIDLIQAEAIQQVVVSKNKLGSGASLDQLSGRLSGKFLLVEEKIIMAMSHLEAMIDFVEEDINPDDFFIITRSLKNIRKEVKELVESYSVGKNLTEGFRVLLFGNTNAGKSSLFNFFLDEERAIVTDIHGTTRDLIQGQVFFGNNLIELIDSAGIRKSEDVIEKIGIDKSFNEIKRADLILHIVDANNKGDCENVELLDKEKTVLVFNKSDLLGANGLHPERESNFYESTKNPKAIFISTFTGAGTKALKKEIINRLVQNNNMDGKMVITQARHFNHLNNLFKSISESIQLLENNESPDIISQELSVGLMELHQILGKEYNDEVLDKVFSEFCIGK